MLSLEWWFLEFKVKYYVRSIYCDFRRFVGSHINYDISIPMSSFFFDGF